jgi:hypothetical protein
MPTSQLPDNHLEISHSSGVQSTTICIGPNSSDVHGLMADGDDMSTWISRFMQESHPLLTKEKHQEEDMQAKLQNVINWFETSGLVVAQQQAFQLAVSELVSLLIMMKVNICPW